MQVKEFTTLTFISFISETILKLQKENNDQKTSYVLIFDNAKIHIGKLVDKTLLNFKIAALTLPAYTPEWNLAELAINFIKSRLNRNL